MEIIPMDSLDKKLDMLTKKRLRRTENWRELDFEGIDFFETTAGYLHYKDCEFLRRTSKLKWIPQDKVDTNKKFCPECSAKLLICYGADDYKKKLNEYMELYKKNGIKGGGLYKFYIEAKAHTLLKGNTLYVNISNEYWKIEFWGEEIKLYHNNYKKGKNEIRYECAGYHEHETREQNLWGIMKLVMRYRYNRDNYQLHVHGDKNDMKLPEEFNA